MGLIKARARASFRVSVRFTVNAMARVRVRFRAGVKARTSFRVLLCLA